MDNDTQKTALYHGLVGAAFLCCAVLVALTAVRAPDFLLPTAVLHPFSLAQEAPPGGETGAVININTATEAELTALPRIGPATAKNILDHRSRRGRFKHPQDIMQVAGIGEKTYEAIKASITVTGQSTPGGDASGKSHQSALVHEARAVLER